MLDTHTHITGVFSNYTHTHTPVHNVHIIYVHVHTTYVMPTSLPSPPHPSPPPLSTPPPLPSMDQILTEFITRTKADPALAHDLLEATEWQLEAALEAYQGLHDTHAVIPEEQIDFAFESGEQKQSTCWLVVTFPNMLYTNTISVHVPKLYVYAIINSHAMMVVLQLTILLAYGSLYC